MKIAEPIEKGTQYAVKEIFDSLIKQLTDNPEIATVTHSDARAIVTFCREDLKKSRKALWLEFNTQLDKLASSFVNKIIFQRTEDISIGETVILKVDKQEITSPSSILKAGTELICVGITIAGNEPRVEGSYYRKDAYTAYVLTDFLGTVFCTRDEFLSSKDL